TPTVCVSSDPTCLTIGRKAFGGRLADQLQERGAARRLAGAVGVTPASVTHWVHGKCAPDEPTFARVCAALRVEPAELAPSGLNPIRKNAKNPLTAWLA